MKSGHIPGSVDPGLARPEEFVHDNPVIDLGSNQASQFDVRCDAQACYDTIDRDLALAVGFQNQLCTPLLQAGGGFLGQQLHALLPVIIIEKLR